MRNWGLDYPNLVALKPDIILICMAGMGQTGPWRDFVSFGPTLQALSGLTALTTFPGQPPIGLTYSYSDHVGGLTAAFSALMALEHRRRTGEGQYVDLSQYEAMTAFMGPLVLQTALGMPPTPTGNRHPTAAPHGIYRCSGDDRWVAITVMDKAQWQAFASAIGSPEWTREERFRTLEHRLANQDELDRLVEEWTLPRSPEEVQERLQTAGVPAGIVASGADLVADPHLRARGFFVEAEHPLLGRITLDRQPIHLSSEPDISYRAAPTPGRDNVDVFGRLLGLTPEEVADLEQRQVIW
jgi:crotonobetainyl-CoA:carnitine CoA-transferase CaiB-like acyl-CoA transferase